MTFRIPAEIQRLFGGQTRSKILGYLANASTPQTGYAVSKSLGIGVSKVYEELRRLESIGILAKSLDSKGSRRFLLRDQDLRNFLVKRIRIASTDDWFSAEKIAERRRAFKEAKRIPANLPSLPVRANRSSRFSEEFRRPREKDRALGRVKRVLGAGGSQ